MNKKEQIEKLEEVLRIIDGVTNNSKSPKQNFRGLTGLDEDLPPLISTAAAINRNLTAEDFTPELSFFGFEMLMFGAALGFAHGKKVAQAEENDPEKWATSNMKTASDAA